VFGESCVSLTHVGSGEASEGDVKPDASEKTGSRAFRELYRTFSAEFRRRWGLIALALLGMVLSVGATLLTPWPVAWILDYIRDAPAQLALIDGTVRGAAALLPLAALSVVAVAALNAGVSYMHRYYEQVASATLVTDIRARVFQQLQSLSLSFRDSWQSGDLVVRMTGDIQDLKRLLVDIPLKWIQWLITLGAITAVLAWNDWRLAALTWAIAPLLFLFTLRFGKGVKQAKRKKKKKESEVASLVAENVAAMALVQAYGRQEDERARFNVENTAARVAELRAVQLSKSFKRIADVLIATGTALVLYAAARLVLEGALSVGVLVVFSVYMKKMYRPVEKLALSIMELAKLQASCERILALVDPDLVVREAADATPAPPLEGRVQFAGVRFGYGDGPDVLSELDFTVEPGETLALVGPSGAGKSTLARLLLRFYDPRDGHVAVDGLDLRSLELRSLRRQITILFQDPMLLRRSIRQNIAFGRPDASDEEIERAARQAHAHDFIEKLPQGYDTLVADRGENLSGGQRQRIAIARAILRDAPIVILDEPYQGLDAQSERQVIDALHELTRERTTFIVAHRFATLRDASRVLVLDPGNPARLGTHDELIAASPGYRRLYELQVGAEHEAGSEHAALGAS
jgi:ABC-type multidrug transport system fused ATPase/permease subunit